MAEAFVGGNPLAFVSCGHTGKVCVTSARTMAGLDLLLSRGVTGAETPQKS